MSGLIIGIIIALIAVCVFVLLLLFMKQPQAAKLTAENVTLDSITYSPVVKKIIDAMVPKETEREYRTCERLIGESGIDITMRGMYFLKLILPFVVLIVLLSIYFINKNVVIDEIISDALQDDVSMFGTTEASKETSNAKKKREKASRDTYQVMSHLVDVRLLKNKSAVDAKLEIQEAIIQNRVSVGTSVEEAVSDFYTKMIQVERAREVSPITIFFFIILAIFGFFIPNLVLMTSKFLRYQSFDNEVIALEMLTILVGSIENITVKEMLKILERNSKVFKKNFEKALLEYPTDFEQALVNLENSSKNKDFQSLISTLRQCATSDKYAALQTLQRRRISRKEYRKMQEEKKIETKTYIALALLIPVLFFLAKLLLAPWTQMITGSGLM
ncbi:MAG: hypothetical protein IJS47_06745 [Clostridia bacterium]|nr:hypothetical protein [Clostridia bacterium]